MKTAIKFSATWCGPCKEYAKIWDQVKTQYPDWTFIEADVDKDHELAREYTIQKVPQTIILINGTLTERRSGLLSQKELRELLT
jgi:thioredoxin 1